MGKHYLKSEISAQIQLCVTLRRGGAQLREICKQTGLPIQTVYNRIKSGAPDLITGEIGHFTSSCTENSKPRLTAKIIQFKPPRTGSASGFISPIPASRLTSRRAFP